MSWRLAESLTKLRNQLNVKYPKRSKVSDGSIGDAAHASRKSDHNPWIKDSKGVGVVTAIDITNDSKIGIDCNKLLNTLLDSKDTRIKYIIFNSKIYQTKFKLVAKPYTGVNPHKHHLHISVSKNPTLFDDIGNWKI